MDSGVVRQLEAAVSAVLIVVVSGNCFGWVTPILVELLGPDSPVPMTSSQASWMIAIIELGNLITPIPAGILSDKWGRKPLILSTGPLYLISWMIILKVHTIEALYVARIIQGLALGIVYTVVPMYLGEIPSPAIRGAITSMFQSAYYFGFLFEYCIGPYVSYQTLTTITTSIPLIFFACFVWQPETPYFLIMRGRETEAAKSLAWLRGKKHVEDVKEELEGINECVKREMSNRASWRDVIATPSDRRALLVVQVVGGIKIMSGSSAITVYCTQLFHQTRFTAISPNVVTIIMGSVLFASSFFSSVLTDITGRRPLLLISTIGCAFSLLAVSVYFFIEANTHLDISKLNWVCPLSVVLYCLFLAFGLDPVSMTYRSEMFPANTRAVASSMNTINFTAGSFVSLKLYQVISDYIGVYFVYLSFSVVCFVGTVWMYFCAIETKGKTLSDIQRELHESSEESKRDKQIKSMDEGIFTIL